MIQWKSEVRFLDGSYWLRLDGYTLEGNIYHSWVCIRSEEAEVVGREFFSGPYYRDISGARLVNKVVLELEP